MRFQKIAVDINGEDLSFNFELLEEDSGGIWVVNSGTKKLFIGEEFNYVNSGIPDEWVIPLINALKKLMRTACPKLALEYGRSTGRFLGLVISICLVRIFVACNHSQFQTLPPASSEKVADINNQVCNYAQA